MEPVTFQLFMPSPAVRRITENQVMAIFWFLCITAFVIWVPDNHGPRHGIGWIYGFLFVPMAVSIMLSAASFARYERLEGTLGGYLSFSKCSIQIDGDIYPLESLTAVDFFVNDYYGKDVGYRTTMNPRRSQGVNNYVRFTEANGQQHRHHFKLVEAERSRLLHPFIKQCIIDRKMSLLRGLELLGIHDYDDIQRFKATLIWPS